MLSLLLNMHRIVSRYVYPQRANSVPKLSNLSVCSLKINTVHATRSSCCSSRGYWILFCICKQRSVVVILGFRQVSESPSEIGDTFYLY
jgi:hypothetical protein